MFNSLTGTLTGKFPQRALLDTGGVEWDLVVPDSSLGALPAVGERARVFVWMQHTESAMTLYGFASEADRRLFLDLTKVDGVGPRSAVRIMCAAGRERLVAALEGGDVAALEKIPGLGKKTAQKMLLALRGKLSLDDARAAPSAASRGEFGDVVDALAGMGYDRRRAAEAVAKVAGELRGGANAPAAGKEFEDALFRRAIVELA